MAVRRVKSGKEKRNQILNQSIARTKRLVENEIKNSAYSAASGSHSSKAPVTPAPNNNNTAASFSRSAPSGSATTSSIKRERDNDVEDVKVETPTKKRVKRGVVPWCFLFLSSIGILVHDGFSPAFGKAWVARSNTVVGK